MGRQYIDKREANGTVSQEHQQSAEVGDGDLRRSMARIALVAGGILILTSALFPVPANPGDLSEFLNRMVENSARARMVLLVVPIGIWAFAVGLLALPPQLTEAWSATWVRCGAYLALIGAGAVTVQFGMGSAALLEASGNDLDAGLALWAGSTHIRAFAMLAVWLGLLLVGVGLIRSVAVSRWLAIVPILLGVVVCWASIAVIVASQTRTTAAVSSGAAAGTALWAIVVGLRFTTSTTDSSGAAEV